MKRSAEAKNEEPGLADTYLRTEPVPSELSAHHICVLQRIIAQAAAPHRLSRPPSRRARARSTRTFGRVGSRKKSSEGVVAALSPAQRQPCAMEHAGTVRTLSTSTVDAELDVPKKKELGSAAPPHAWPRMSRTQSVLLVVNLTLAMTLNVRSLLHSRCRRLTGLLRS